MGNYFLDRQYFLISSQLNITDTSYAVHHRKPTVNNRANLEYCVAELG